MVLNLVYGGLDDECKVKLDLASRGAFTEYTHAQGCKLLDKINLDHRAWELDKGGDGGVELDYDCIKTYSKSGKVENLSEKFHLDSDPILQIVEYYTEHLQAPK